MPKYISGEDRYQLNMLPMALDDMIPEDSPARVIDALVDSLDLQEMNFTHANPKKTGRKPYNPKHLLKLYIYGYFNGIRTTRKLEKECHRNIEVMWLLDNLKPDDRTISNFRQFNEKGIIQVFKEFSMLCSELGLYGKEIVAIDGSKFRANNSRRKNFTLNKVKKMLIHYESSANKYMKLLESTDKEEVKQESKEDLLAKIKKAQDRIEELRELEKDIKKNGNKSITDPDAKHMQASNYGTDVSHNVQIAVDAKNHLVAAIDVTSDPTDYNYLHSMAKDTMKNLKLEKLTVLADKGYYRGDELEKCMRDNITPIVAKQIASNQSGNPAYNKDQFIYDKERNLYICPEGQELTSRNRKTTQIHTYTNYEACKNCESSDQCHKSIKGRKIARGPYQKIYDIVDKNLQDNKELYKQRQMIVEHPFGTIKRTLGFNYFLTRGNKKVKAESFMHFFIYNLKRVINIVGASKLIQYIRAKQDAQRGVLLFLNIYKQIMSLSL